MVQKVHNCPKCSLLWEIFGHLMLQCELLSSVMVGESCGDKEEVKGTEMQS